MASLTSGHWLAIERISKVTGSQVSYPSGYAGHASYHMVQGLGSGLACHHFQHIVWIKKQVPGLPRIPRDGKTDNTSWWEELQSHITRGLLWPFLQPTFRYFSKSMVKNTDYMSCNELLEVPWGTFQGDGLLTLGANVSLHLSSCCYEAPRASVVGIQLFESSQWEEGVKIIRIMMIITFK